MYLGIALLRQSKFDEAEKELLVARRPMRATRHGQLLSRRALLAKEGLSTRGRAIGEVPGFTPNAPDAERVRATIQDFRSRITPE
jgi:hypothetical protein